MMVKLGNKSPVICVEQSALFSVSRTSFKKHSQHECSLTTELDWKLDFWFQNQALAVTYCLSHSKQVYGVLYWIVPLPDKLENCYELLSAFQFVYDSVCLHWGLLNWLWNRLEMVLLLYTSHNSPSHQSGAIFYLEDDVSIRVCQPLTAALWVVVLGGAYC